MPDERWATLIALGTIVVLRVMDTVLPKGYISRWVGKYLMRKPPEDDK